MKWVRTVSTVISFALGGFPSSLAAASTDLTALSLEELTNLKVTSVSRRSEKIFDAPAAVHVITQEDIRHSGATKVVELLRLVPGMDVARIDNNKWAVCTRGFMERFGSKLLVQIDGRILYNPANSGVYWDAVDYPLDDIERIEVIRGPGASVWGANAVNGIVNITTKSAKDTLGGRLEAGGGNEEQGFGGIRYGGRREEDLYYRVYAKGFNRDKQFSSAGNTHDAWKGGSSGFRIDRQLANHDTLTVQGDFLRSEAGRKDVRPMIVSPYVFTNLETESSSNANLLGRYSHKTGDDSGWSVRAYWDYFRRHADNLELDLDWDTYDIDFQHELALGKRQKIVYGTGYRVIDVHLSDSERDNGFFLNLADNRRVNQLFSFFVQNQIALVQERLVLTLGSKFEHNAYTGFEIQPTARLLWTPTERQSLWGAVSRAVRTPTFTEVGVKARLIPSSTVPTFTQTTGNPDLNSEEVLAHELGYRVQMTDTLSMDSALFYNTYTGLIGTVALPSQAGPSGSTTVPVLRINGLGAVTHGGEVGMSWQATSLWRLYGSYSFVEMNIYRENPRLSATADAAEQQSPRHQGYLKSSLSLPHHVELDLISHVVDKIRGFNPSGAPGVTNDVGAYASLDARLAWQAHSNLELAVIGQNLLQSHHVEFGTSPQIRSPLIAIQRSVFALVTWKW